MRHRIFIAINLPQNIKKELLKFQDKWPELPARWTKPENLHITLEFLGYVSDEELLDVFKKTEDFASKQESFEIKLDKICYGPPGKLPPRLVWATGGKYHITLARIRTWQWKQIEPEERPQVEEEINLSFEANSVEVMESILKRGGPEYSVLQSYSLK